MRRHGGRYVPVLMPWGETRIRVQRWRCARDKLVHSDYPAGMDASGFSPEVMKRAIDMCSRLPYREARVSLALQGINLSLGQYERLSQAYGQALVAYSDAWIAEQVAGKTTTAKASDKAVKHYVLQVDGVMVMEKDKPVKGQCEGREVKQALLYPLTDRQDKDHLGKACGCAEFSEVAQALLNYRSVQADDVLIGIADGAPWIDKLFSELNVSQRILDVYHATQYQDTVMLALGYDEATRQAQRASWCRGDVNVRDWLAQHVPAQTDLSRWSKSAFQALMYLRKRLDQMDYLSFRDKGFPIGSGAIEGANKSVIGARMKRGGMRWSQEGVNRMAMMRSLQTTSNPWVDFHEIRLKAFNH